MTTSPARIVVAGIGNAYREDDGVGVAVADAVAASASSVRDIGPIAEPLDLLGKWDFVDLAVVIDATRSGSAAGTIVVSDLDDDGAVSLVRAAQHTSTHGLGMPDVLRLSRALGAAPRRVVLVGIEGRSFGAGVTMCEAVVNSVPRATALVLQLLAAAS